MNQAIRTILVGFSVTYVLNQGLMATAKVNFCQNALNHYSSKSQESKLLISKDQKLAITNSDLSDSESPAIKWSIKRTPFSNKNVFALITKDDLSRYIRLIKENQETEQDSLPSIASGINIPTVTEAKTKGLVRVGDSELILVHLEKYDIDIPIPYSQLALSSDYYSARSLVGKSVYAKGYKQYTAWIDFDSPNANISRNQKFQIKKVELLEEKEQILGSQLVIGITLNNKWITYKHFFRPSRLSFAKAFNNRFSYSDMRSFYSKKFGRRWGTLIANEKIGLGMTQEMVENSWGSPNSINRSAGSWGVHEQWVYDASYLYFENGILTSWQD